MTYFKESTSTYYYSNKMEDETRAFLILILNTISLVLLWMMVNVFVGIYFGYAFFEKEPTWKNIVYYLFFVATIVALLLHLKRKWRM